jgi:hypothetical protein
MKRSSLLFFLAVSVLFHGCATPEGRVLSSVEGENLVRLQAAYGTQAELQRHIHIAELDSSGATRNELLSDLILLVDLNYYHWEKLVYDKKAYTDFGSAVTATTLSSVSALVGANEIKTILSAISSGITSTGVTFNSKVLQDQSVTAILAKMRANRATQFLKLRASMTALDAAGNPIGPTPLSRYSVRQGLIDIALYYNSGTFVSAIQDIVEKAAAEKTTSDSLSNSISPNGNLVNAAQNSGGTVQRVMLPPPPTKTIVGHVVPKDVQTARIQAIKTIKALNLGSTVQQPFLDDVRQAKTISDVDSIIAEAIAAKGSPPNQP